MASCYYGDIERDYTVMSSCGTKSQHPGRQDEHLWAIVSLCQDESAMGILEVEQMKTCCAEIGF